MRECQRPNPPRFLDGYNYCDRCGARNDSPCGLARIADSPPGLISRRMFPIDQGRVVVEEKWNIETPGCPLVRNPWGNLGLDTGPICIRQTVMSEREYAEARIQLRHEG